MIIIYLFGKIKWRKNFIFWKIQKHFIFLYIWKLKINNNHTIIIKFWTYIYDICKINNNEIVLLVVDKDIFTLNYLLILYDKISEKIIKSLKLEYPKYSNITYLLTALKKSKELYLRYYNEILILDLEEKIIKKKVKIVSKGSNLFE